MPESKVQRRAAAIARHHPEQLYKRNRGFLKMDAKELHKMASAKEKGLPSRVSREDAAKRVDERGINFMVAVIKGIEPKDQLETMLGAQMATVHKLTMAFARRLGAADTFQELDSVERIFNKLARTFAGQMETLKRYRTGGEQKVTVEHVTVNEGGQAIVGNVAHRGEGPSKKPETTS